MTFCLEALMSVSFKNLVKFKYFKGLVYDIYLVYFKMTYIYIDTKSLSTLEISTVIWTPKPILRIVFPHTILPL